MPETSVVIRSFNEAEHIGDVLHAVDDQAYADFEIILVDSGSTDGTLEIAEEYVDKIEFVAPNNFTFGYSCNVGCEAASGEFISFLSAHAIPTDEQWLGTMVNNLRDENVAMSYSNQIGSKETKFSEKRLFSQLFPDERKRQTPPEYFANNASSAIQKSLWEEYKFDEYLTGHEDIEWAKHFMDNGYVVVYEPDACIYHIHDETWEQIFHRFEREAVADVMIGVKKPSDRWHEFIGIFTDSMADSMAALRERKLSPQTFVEIAKFRYNQHMGTAAGLQSEPDLESNRYDYFYADANKKIVVDANGGASVERSPLPEIKPNEVLLRTEYVAVSSSPNQPEPGEMEATPYVPSGNYVGTVADIGANANSVEIGDIVVGESRFYCDLCPACDEGNYRMCEQPTKLGVDTDVGPYAQFFSVPSDHVYPLPDEINPREGVLVGTLAQVALSIERVTELLPDGDQCVVLGDSPKAHIAAQLLRDNQLTVTQLSTSESVSPDLSDVGIVIDTTGDSALVEDSIEQTLPGTVILLLGDGYGRIAIDDVHLNNKTVMKPGNQGDIDLSKSIELLPMLDTNQILNGTYSLDAVESAWTDADNGKQLSVLSVDS